SYRVVRKKSYLFNKAIAMMKKAASDGAQMGYQKAVQSIATGQGDLYRALMGKTTSGRKIS
ncbi:hypothetical protein N5I76_21410, partial [Klebsiella quasipneumoniae]|uniref:hypothetical protein n=1 Tax=Klebsiella quasipneumoniae TaxID=1463165 RepID=UPI0022459404